MEASDYMGMAVTGHVNALESQASADICRIRGVDPYAFTQTQFGLVLQNWQVEWVAAKLAADIGRKSDAT